MDGGVSAFISAAHSSPALNPSIMQEEKERKDAMLKTPTDHAQRDCARMLALYRAKLLTDKFQQDGKTVAVARLQHLCEKGVSVWLDVTPTAPGLALNNDEFRFGARHLLGLPPVDIAFRCECGAITSGHLPRGEHHQSCVHVRRRGATARHDVVKYCIQRMARELGVDVQSEPALDGFASHAVRVRVVSDSNSNSKISDDKDKDDDDDDDDDEHDGGANNANSGRYVSRLRPDLVFWHGGQLVDVAVVYVESPGYVEKRVDGMQTAVNTKARKYRALAKRHKLNINSFVVSTHGLLSKSAVSIVKSLARLHSTELKWPAIKARVHVMRTVAIAIQRGNARFVRDVLSRARA